MTIIKIIQKKMQAHHAGHCGCGHGAGRPDNEVGAPTKITKDMIVREVADRWPQTVAVFGNHQVDFCCGGAHSIEQTARARLRGRSFTPKAFEASFGAAQARGCRDIDSLVSDLNAAIAK